MKSIWTLLFFSSIFTCLYSQQGKTKIVVLGVTHSMQLANSNQQPAVLRSFFNKVRPNALCIEISPEHYAQNDFYEFTYEQQYCLVPYAMSKSVPIYPFDWWPPADDLTLSLGFADAEYPPFTRRANNFLGFLFFNDSSVYRDGFYYAETEKARTELKGWYTVYPDEVQYDFPRRLFLYRTFMQAMHIKKVAETYSGDTILVVVGSYHKDDIEKILSGSGFTIISPIVYGQIDSGDIEKNHNSDDDYAIASFNLLGLQSTTPFIDTAFVNKSLCHLEKRNTAEVQFFRTRYSLLTKQISSTQAIEGYRKIIQSLSKETKFSWTGVKNDKRIDSYFDPFGNMTIWQRINLEIAREYFRLNDQVKYNNAKELIMIIFSGLKKALLSEYINKYIEK